ncbi:MAG: TonB-dependent receptor, partial [Alistipes sp.]|nr:TonB-dependent receptor [Alistipes sp.]
APISPDNFGDRLYNSFFEILPKVTATVRFDARNSLYASVSKGYKAGGFNTQMFSEVQQSRLMKQMGVAMHRMSIDEIVAYKPEYSWNYEVGAHTATADGRFVAEAALFYIDCRDQQLTVFPEGQTTGRMMTNAGKTRSFGGEMSARVSPFKNFDVSLSYGYTNARFVEFRSGKSDYAGQYVPYAPQHTSAARATYEIAIPTRWLERIVLGVGYKGVGPIYWNEENSLKQNYYSLLDASVRLAGPHYSVEVWGKNLTGAKYAVFHFESISHPFLQMGRPRMFGVTLNINV